MNEGIKALSFLLGTWKTEGQVLATKDSEAVQFNGTDSYESVLNGSFVLHKVDIMMSGERVEVIELIGTNKDGSYLLLSFDNTGTTSTMQAVLQNNGVMNIYDDSKRAILVQVNNNELRGEWQKNEAGNWVDWMKLTLTRI